MPVQQLMYSIFAVQAGPRLKYVGNLEFEIPPLGVHNIAGGQRGAA